MAMTLRVYRVGPKGQITFDSGKRSFGVGNEGGTATSPESITGGGFPPCSCSRCRRPR